MKFVHISDLHIGKKLKEASLEEDQKYILAQIVGIVEEVHPDGVIIAGDVYDTTTPNTDSVSILDVFLTSLAELNVPVYMISGNHDSPEKLGFGSQIFKKNDLFISGTFSGALDVHTLTKGDECVDVCMLPFIRPGNVRRAYPDEEINSYSDAVISAIEHTEFSEGRKKILVTHQFIVSGSESPLLSESESVFVGTAESIDASIFDDFDYVALGHIHKPQSVGRDTIRYCGTPLKYSRSEIDDVKSVTVVDIGETVSISTIPLVPMRDIRLIRGPLARLVEEGKKDGHNEDFIYAVLDKDEIDSIQRLRDVYPNILHVESAERAVSDELLIGEEGDPWGLNIDKVFADFFEMKTGKKLTESQMKIVKDSFEEEESL